MSCQVVDVADFAMTVLLQSSSSWLTGKLVINRVAKQPATPRLVLIDNTVGCQQKYNRREMVSICIFGQSSGCRPVVWDDTCSYLSFVGGSRQSFSGPTRHRVHESIWPGSQLSCNVGLSVCQTTQSNISMRVPLLKCTVVTCCASSHQSSIHSESPWLG